MCNLETAAGTIPMLFWEAPITETSTVDQDATNISQLPAVHVETSTGTIPMSFWEAPY
jgi:hypothetical protein